MEAHTATNTATARQLRAKARSMRVLAAVSLEPVAVAYRRRAAELELMAAVRAGDVRLAYVTNPGRRVA
jgi:hypothetical protein